MSTLSDWWNNSWLGQTVQGLSDTFFGTTYGQQRLQQNQADINRFLSGEQRDWEEYMWNQSNAYNSPDAQMQRLRDAGLNPSLVYGQPISEAGVPAGAEGSVGLGSAQHGSFTPQGIYQLDLLQSQRELLDAQKDEIRSRIPVNESKVNVNNMTVEDIKSKIEQRLHQNALTDKELDNISFEQMMKNKYFVLDSKRLRNETKLTDVQITNLDAQTQKYLAEAKVSQREYDEMIYTFAIRAAGLEASVRLSEAQISQALATAKKLGVDAQKVQQDISIATPEMINSQSWADDMSGKNGKLNLIGSNITYQAVNTLKGLFSFVIKK